MLTFISRYSWSFAKQSQFDERIRKIKRIIQRVDPTAPHEVLLVLDATTGQNAMNQAKQFKETTDVSGLVLTKLDGTAKDRLGDP